jgi:hypothetical protein
MQNKVQSGTPLLLPVAGYYQTDEHAVGKAPDKNGQYGNAQKNNGIRNQMKQQRRET